MTIGNQPEHVTSVDGNIFLDLGFSPDEAMTLQAQSNRIISEKLILQNELIPKTHNSTD